MYVLWSLCIFLVFTRMSRESYRGGRFRCCRVCVTSLLSGDLLSYLLITFSLCISLSLVYRGPHLPPRSSFPLVSIALLCLLGIEGDPFLTHSVCVDRSVFWVLREVHFFALLFVPIALSSGY